MRLRAPEVFSATLQKPAATVAVHELTPSVTVTLPLGTGPPWVSGTTEYATETACPMPDGSGESAVIVVVVL